MIESHEFVGSRGFRGGFCCFRGALSVQGDICSHINRLSVFLSAERDVIGEQGPHKSSYCPGVLLGTCPR